MIRVNSNICLSFFLSFTLTISSTLSALSPNSSNFDNIKEWIGGTGNWDVVRNLESRQALKIGGV